MKTLTFLFLLLLSNQLCSQDEIVIKKTGQPLDFDLKITEVSNDTIKFQAFNKNKAMPLSEVNSYKIRGNPSVHLINGNKVPIQQQKQIKSITIEQMDSISRAKKLCLTIGLLQGGGSLLGADIEVKLIKRLSVQGGLGFKGFGAAINYHLKPGIKSSCLALSFWHQGLDKTYVQSVLGTTYVYRHRKGFTAQIGIGKVLELSSYGEKIYKAKFPKSTPPPVILMYSIGWYFGI